MDKEKLIAQLIGNVDTSSEHYVTVAELRTEEAGGLVKTIDINTALVPPSLISKIKASHVNPCVESKGAYYDEEYTYLPHFWLYLSKSNGLRKTEPLVVSWESSNNTMLIVDQGFVGTFKLTPRLIGGCIYWDDLSRPKYDIVKNQLISEYNYPRCTRAYVQMDKEYLKDYLCLRKKVAIQVYTITQNIFLNTEILSLLGGQDHYVEEFKQYEIRIRKFDHKENIARLEINGYKLLFDSYVPKKIDTPIGHYWKGIDGLVSEWRARHEMPFEYVYVSDEVLAKYEDNDNYEIYPLYGSVRYRGQWGISHCKRIGRNGIKLEIKKLYEGVPDEIIDYWNKFSIDSSEIDKGENIVLKAERLTRNYFLFGRLFSNVINRICEFNFTPSDIIALDEAKIEYTGWTEFPDYKPITNHVNIHLFSKEQFISRCKKLYILLGENLQESPLRKSVNILGFPIKDTQKLKGLRLLELLLKYIYISEKSGLDPLVQNESIVERVAELKDFNILSEFHALNGIRQLDAHKSDGTNAKLYSSLKIFGIEVGSITNSYAMACEQVYDRLNGMLQDINDLLLKFDN